MSYVVGLMLLGLGGWASAWGVFASYHRPAPHHWLGGGVALLGVVCVGLGIGLLVQPGFLW